MPFIKKTTGDQVIDKVISEIYEILNILDLSSTSSTTTGSINSYITPEGGFAVRFKNSTGSSLYKGYLTKISDTDSESALIAEQGCMVVCGAVYNDILLDGEYGYMVTHGPADVYFNTNGAVAGNWFRISKSSDSVNTDNGKAQSEDIARIDNFRFKGMVRQNRFEEGLSRCLITR